MIRYLIALGAATTIVLTPGCLEQKVSDYPIPPKLGSDAKGMTVGGDYLEPVIKEEDRVSVSELMRYFRSNSINQIKH